MRVFGKWLGRVLLALVLLGALVWVWKREEIDRLIAVFYQRIRAHPFQRGDLLFVFRLPAVGGGTDPRRLAHALRDLGLAGVDAVQDRTV